MSLDHFVRRVAILRALSVGCVSAAALLGAGCREAGAKAIPGRSEATPMGSEATPMGSEEIDAPAYARLTDELCDPTGGCSAAAPPVLLDVIAKERFAPHLVTDASPPPPVAKPVAVAKPALPPLDGKPFVALPVMGFEDAVVALPTGATGPAPVVVAVHGHFDKPEPFCAAWAKIFQNKAFVLCPRGMLAPGSPWGDKRFSFVEAHSTELEIDASLAALRAAPYAAYVDAHKPVYAGFSLGAFMGVPIARHRGQDFSSMILVAGNLDLMTRSMLEDFVGTGGERMMLVCAEGKEALHACSNQANRIVQRLEGFGGDGVVIDAGRAGHSYEGKVAKALAVAIPEFLGDDPRFASLLPADTAPPAVIAASVTTPVTTR